MNIALKSNMYLDQWRAGQEAGKHATPEKFLGGAKVAS